MSKKGELEGLASYGKKSGLDAGMCYALTDNIAIMSNLQWNNQGGLDGETGKGNYIQRINYKMLEIAPGYYINSKDNSPRKIEIFGGVGFGNSNRIFRHYEYRNFLPIKYQGDFYRTFIQLNVGYVSNNFEACMSGRLANVYFPRLEVVGLADYNNANPTSIDNFNKFYFETAINISMGFKNIKFNTQAGISASTNNDFFSRTEPLLRLGLQYRFNLLKEKG